MGDDSRHYGRCELVGGGPYQSKRNFKLGVDALISYVNVATEHDELLSQILDPLHEMVGDSPSLNFGAREHLIDFLKALPFDVVAEKMSEKMKWTR